MAETDGGLGVTTVKERRWKSLIHVAELLSHGNLQLDDLLVIDQIQKTLRSEGQTSNSSSSNPNSPCKPEKGRRSSTVVGPALPETLKSKILSSGGSLESVVFLIEKKLRATDVNRNDNRISLPLRQIRNEFLRPDERDLLESSTVGFPASLIEPCLKECTVTFCLWKSNGMFALRTGWYDVCKRNKLDDRTVVRVWSFRRKSKLCFAIIKAQ